MYKLCVYIPEDSLENVKTALFNAGAGKMGNYDCCCWQSAGQGQFRPLSGSNPTLGQHNTIETVTEYKVEMVCNDDVVKHVVQRLRQAHPYEEPAFDLTKIVNV